jgi:hypothetical protein
MVTIRTDHSDGDGLGAEFLRLQTEFQARLADETLRYLRSLQSALGPASPGTVVRADPETTLEGSACPGGRGELALKIENRQAAHCVVTPALSPLTEPSGTTWFPELDSWPLSTLIPPGETRELELVVRVPPQLPVATYRGALFLQGLRWHGVPVVLTIKRPRGVGARSARPARTEEATRVSARRGRTSSQAAR